MYTVYCHTFPNGKKYIGVTCQRPECRWSKDGNGYKTSEYVYNAIKKYGWNNIEHEIIATGLTMKEASEIEINLIALYRTSEKEYGYNISKGGVKNYGVMSESTKEKLRAANVGKIMSKQTREKISKTMKGQKKSLETRRKMCEAQKKSFANGNNAMHSKESREKAHIKLKGRIPIVAIQKSMETKYHSVINLETKIIYKSIKEAAEKNGINRSTIIRHCEGKFRKQKWQYIEDYKKIGAEVLDD